MTDTERQLPNQNPWRHIWIAMWKPSNMAWAIPGGVLGGLIAWWFG